MSEHIVLDRLFECYDKGKAKGEAVRVGDFFLGALKAAWAAALADDIRDRVERDAYVVGFCRGVEVNFPDGVTLNTAGVIVAGEAVH